MSLKYNDYLKDHISAVQQGLDWLDMNLILDKEAILDAQERLNTIGHDASKYTSEEYEAYDDYFYGSNQTAKVKEAFDYAWLHHIHNNPHHWQYWLLVNDDEEDGTKALKMPLSYVYEMIADWWSFSWRQGNLMEIFDWYKKHQKRMILHKETRAVVEDILSRMQEILEMQKKLEGKAEYDDADEIDELIEHSDLKEDNDKKFGVPELKKFPMPDADHVRSAIRFFNYVDPKHEKELAEAILERMDEYGLSFDDFGVGDENRFKKYIPKEKLEKK